MESAYAITQQKPRGFTLVELLIVIVIIGILAAISLVTYNGVQQRARDTARIHKIKSIEKALSLYKIDNGDYPHIVDGGSWESACGSQTENWGHCDRMKKLSDALKPYMNLDPVSMSDATQGNRGYYYNSNVADDYQTYGMMAYLESDGGANDGGVYDNAYEIGERPSYCAQKYTGSDRAWIFSASSYDRICAGGK